MNSGIIKMISFIDGLLRMVLFLGTALLMTVFIWGARERHHLGQSGFLEVLSSFPPIAICLLGLLGAFYKNTLWLKLYTIAMIIMALGYTIFIICVDKTVSTSVSAFILFHYILAYLAHYLGKTIEDQRLHSSLMRSYIQHNQRLHDHLLPINRQTCNSNYLQNACYINPALEPPPSYNSVSPTSITTTPISPLNAPYTHTQYNSQQNSR